jgi:hypothetical protein
MTKPLTVSKPGSWTKGRLIPRVAPGSPKRETLDAHFPCRLLRRPTPRRTCSARTLTPGLVTAPQPSRATRPLFLDRAAFPEERDSHA